MVAFSAENGGRYDEQFVNLNRGISGSTFFPQQHATIFHNLVAAIQNECHGGNPPEGIAPINAAHAWQTNFSLYCRLRDEAALRAQRERGSGNEPGRMQFASESAWQEFVRDRSKFAARYVSKDLQEYLDLLPGDITDPIRDEDPSNRDPDRRPDNWWERADRLRIARERMEQMSDSEKANLGLYIQVRKLTKALNAAVERIDALEAKLNQ